VKFQRVLRHIWTGLAPPKSFRQRSTVEISPFKSLTRASWPQHGSYPEPGFWPASLGVRPGT
jgi:hypothetical protein